MNRRLRTRPSVVVSILCAAAFVVLATLVAARTTQPLDVAARGFFRPTQAWTPTQARADVLVEGLRPAVDAALLVLAALVLSVHRRSPAPLVTGLLIGLVGGLTALAAKVLVARPDPGDVMSTLGGSFPSGHVLSVLVCLGGAVLVATPRPRWWAWLVVLLLTAGMGWGLLVQSAHWLTDVAGGALLGTSVLAGAYAVGAGRATTAPPGRHRAS